MNARTFLTRQEIEEVKKTITEAEDMTQAEFVCAIATESGRYDRAESIAGLAFSIILLSVANALLPAASSGSWSTQQVLPLGWQAGMVVLGFIAGSGIATIWHSLRRVFVFRQEIDEEVQRSASYVFSLAMLSRTARRSGILLYLSLFERRVVVLADEGVFQALGQEGVDELRDLALSHLTKGRRCEPFTASLKRAAEKLREKLPPGDHNELSNEVLIYHPRP